MVSKKTVTLFVFLAIIGIGVFVFIRQRQPVPAEILKAEQEVYSVLLVEQKKYYSDPPVEFQIVEYTNNGELNGNMPIDSAGINSSFDMNKSPSLQRNTWIDYQKKNKVSYPIKDYLSLSSKVILVNPGAGKQLYWWVSFSRIGFNSSLTQALVLVGDCRGESCYDSTKDSMYSQGFYVFLQKNKGQWTIRDEQFAWLIEAPSP